MEWLWTHDPNRDEREEERILEWKACERGVGERFSYLHIQASVASRLEWLETIASAGIAFLAGVPAEENRVLEVAELIGWVRETNYGRVFDVRAIANPNNLAYTGRALGLHTDNPYREPVPGLQMLHCLRAGAEGGGSLFADGFAVAEVLRSEVPEAFEVLTATPVRFRFRNARTDLWADRPMIQLNGQGSVEAIHYNSRSISPVRLRAAHIPGFYRAYRAFSQLLHDPRHFLTTQLVEGEVVVFDNRRVLHGRTAFAALSDSSSHDARHLQGCYLEQDGLRSQITILRKNGLH